MWPPGAQQQMVAEIDTARTSLAFTSEELTDTKVVDALAAAVRREVGCRIVLTASAQWAPAFTTVTPPAAPSTPSSTPGAVLYIHEKLILIDGTSMLIGLQNATRISLDTNREVSVIVTSPALVKAAADTFGTD